MIDLMKRLESAACHAVHGGDVQEAIDRIRLLVEAIESYTGNCPEFKTLEPCLSEECLTFRRALAGLEADHDSKTV
jgi:hypothetical protein